DGPLRRARRSRAGIRRHGLRAGIRRRIAPRLGSTKFFTPLGMNLSGAARRILSGRLPPEDALLTGPEMAQSVLLPLASSPELAGRVHVGCRVQSIGRSGLSRMDYAGHPLRSERPFRIVVERRGGEEMREADVVFDATGGYSIPNSS